ncbi:hypothetical protein NLU13_8488 [Sarocladium strictum]|uniref:Rhodopsin domain-containing protein n=1 Tax=Sarocladium strictum TaxID=5046 RepID=A0AA39GCA1_SARSR|nr:hypothetical protein NLU13_8488 [Sarocladium strictum]
MAVTAVFHSLALFFVGVRMYTRFIVVKAPKIDDAFMVLATIGALGSGMVMFILQASKGLGRHRQTIPDEDFVKFRLYGWVYSVVCAVVSFSLLKVSITLSLLRLSRARWFTWSLYSLIGDFALLTHADSLLPRSMFLTAVTAPGFITAYTIVALCSFFFHCRPIEGSFNATIKSVCYSRELFIAFSIMNTAFNMFSDVMCATLPIPIIWTLNMKLRTRLYLIGVLSLGYITVGMGGIKAYFQLGARRDPDSQFEQNIQFYGFLQINLGIIVACAPTLRPLLGRALKLSSRDRYYGSYYGNRSGNQRSTRQRMGTFPEDGFEMDDNVTFNKAGQVKTTIHGGATAVYDKNGSRSGSEEVILQGTEPGVILRTTQINVR